MWMYNEGKRFSMKEIFCITVINSIGREFFFDEFSMEQEDLIDIENSLETMGTHSSLTVESENRKVFIDEISSYDIEYK